jgi:hypothetical protein
VRAAALLLAIFLFAVSAGASAQEDARASARAHFSRGIELYDEGRLAQAAAEFREAYRLAPSAAVLFNVAQVEAELGHAVEAVDAYERIMTDPAVTPSMRADSEQALAVQRRRIATLRVTVNVTGARVAIDDVEVGTAPLGELPVSEGEHVVTARADGYAPVSYRFVVAGGATHEATLTLTLSGTSVGSLRVESRVPGIAIVIDGQPFGLTPLDSAIALTAGTHHLEARRPGYTLFAQDVSIAPGGESRVSVVVEEDPSAPPSSRGTLRLALPTASAQLRIDGLPADEAHAHDLELPAGLHDVDVRVAEREPFTQRIDVLPQIVYDLHPPYEWTPDAREARIGGSHTQRDLGIGLLTSGLAAIIGGVAGAIAVRVDYESHLGPLTAALNGPCHNADVMWAAVESMCRPALAGRVDLPPDTATDDQAPLIARTLMGANHDLNTYYAMIGITSTIAGIGGVLTVLGGVMLGTAPSEHQIDASARASRGSEGRGAQGPDFRLSLGPTSLTLSGTF